VSKSRSTASSASGSMIGSGLKVERRFTRPGVDPFDEVQWEMRTASITNEKGEVVFEQKDVEIPASWSQMATNVVVSKYFRGQLGTSRRETSVKQLIGRVTNTIADWGVAQGYFASDADAEAFRAELAFLCVTQRMAFNSPVWFNVGVEEKPQGSACFINSIEDTMESILGLAKTEGMLFKYGSGAGVNLSPLRGSMEKLKHGGTASGPVSFMKGFDAFAGAIKSGGATRRAAKMVILNVDHPDIEEFINCKVKEERKAWALIDAGYDGSYTGEAYGSVFFQNSNNSIRVPDEFMMAVEKDSDWHTLTVTEHKPLKNFKARDLMRQISDAAWVCGDPGMQYDTIIQDWNCVANTARINATNPCSEFVFIDDTACIAPEMRISTPDGLRTAEQLFQLQDAGEQVMVTTDIYSEHDHRRVTAHRPAHVTRIGEKPVVKVTLQDGRQVRATADHRFLTEAGWKRIDEVEVGRDRVQLRQSGNAVEFGSPAGQVKRWQMLGWLTGDGVFNEDTLALVFGPREQRTSIGMSAELNQLKAVAAGGNRIRASAVSTQWNGVMQTSSSQGSLVGFLEGAYGFRQGTATSKDVPTAIHSVTEDLRVAYLQGLFSADGCIRHDSRATEPEVMLASSSPELLRSVQLILSDLGITSRIAWTHPAGRANPQGQLHIYNQQARKFLALVGMPLSDDKTRVAAEILDRRFGGALKNPRASKVVSIVPDGTETVYDVTEPVTHSLIVEGMVTHNCNLASLNLLKFIDEDGTFLTEDFKHAVRITITAQELIVPNASYPTPRIEENSHKLRPLGLGFANLGALLMSEGLPYDSDEGRAYGAAITSLMTAEAYAQSARISGACGGPFELFAENREPMLRVMNKHMAASYNIDRKISRDAPIEAACQAWEEAVALGVRHGYRNAQATVLAPTGTIAFMMDCDTTGVEPDIALVKYKKLVGGGLLKIVNHTVPRALRKLHYDASQVDKIIGFITDNDTIEGAPQLRPEHLPVFDCAFKPAKGERSIHYMGHLKMVAAAQPFISGSISKTINLPELATVEDIEQAYIDGWKMGLKCISVYRDNCKRSQPLNTRLDEQKPDNVEAVATRVPPRTKLPDERQSITHKFDIQGHEGYITVSMFEDGKPGEIFVKMAKEGSTLSGMMDSFAIMVSLALQYGVPLEALVSKFSHVRFEPSGYTSNPEIPIAKSIVDYIFRWLASKFYDEEGREAIGIIKRAPKPKAVDAPKPRDSVARPDTESGSDSGSELRVLAAGVGGVQAKVTVSLTDSMTCSDCGAIMVRAGACYKCLNCGSTSGCG
jgi:ribonucleoside-diphosphate reductase alpha chain